MKKIYLNDTAVWPKNSSGDILHIVTISTNGGAWNTSSNYYKNTLYETSWVRTGNYDSTTKKFDSSAATKLTQATIDNIKANITKNGVNPSRLNTRSNR